jgi:hypothetical protein
VKFMTAGSGDQQLAPLSQHDRTPAEAEPLHRARRRPAPPTLVDRFRKSFASAMDGFGRVVFKTDV